MKYVICVHRKRNIDYFYGHPALLPDALYITSQEVFKCEMDKLSGLVDWVFFIDWSWKIPKKIYENFQCVVFHAADLPNFAGGSPIQNQIMKGIKKTKLTAFVVDEEMDGGDILLQRDLSLEGHVGEIWNRICVKATLMIVDIITGNYERRKQPVGKGSYYVRRKPEQSRIQDHEWNLVTLDELYDKIRMLEDPYPNAFMDGEGKKITFKTADFDGKRIRGTYEIE